MKYLFLLLIMTLSTTISGQSIIGQWETYDEKTDEKKSVVEIYEIQGVYYAKIIETFIDNKNAICTKCKGTKKGKTIIGLVIIEEIRKKGNKFGGGTILDPESGNTYKCSLELIDNDKLKVRGFLGISLFGRTQYWVRKEYGTE